MSIHKYIMEKVPDSGNKADTPAVEFARSYLRLANLLNFALDRLSRYETNLSRQATRILYALEMLDRRKPQEQTRRLWFGSAGAMLASSSRQRSLSSTHPPFPNSGVKFPPSPSYITCAAKSKLYNVHRRSLKSTSSDTSDIHAGIELISYPADALSFWEDLKPCPTELNARSAEKQSFLT